MIIYETPVDDVLKNVRNLIRERYHKANTQGKIEFSKKLLSEIRLASVEELIIAAAKARLAKIKKLEEERLEEEKKKKAEFERKQKEVLDKWELIENKTSDFIRREKELSDG